MIKPKNQNTIAPRIVALTPLQLYLERVKSVSDSLRAAAESLDYVPLQFGGIQGQQESLKSNCTVKVIDFKVTSTE